MRVVCAMDYDLFQKTFSQGPVSIFRWKNVTGEWPVVEVTPNIEELTGWTAEDFLAGKISYASLIHPEDLERVSAEEDAWKQTKSQKGINLKYRIVTKDGEERQVSEFTQNVFDEDGEIPFLTGYIMDVTGQHESEKARRYVEAAERSKAEFLANMSHELRTPMNGIMGMTELLSKTELDNRQRGFADIILRSGSALVTILNDILDFSKLDAGDLRLEIAPFELESIIDEVTTVISPAAAEKDLEIIVRYAPELPRKVMGDAGRLRQIMTNLLSNAVKFTDNGHILVDVSGTVSGERVGLEFRVEDTGIGIPADKCATIFEKFSQVDGSATRKYEGTGLGLAIASSLVELMDGEIGVDSSYGRGSTFWFDIRLPIKRDCAEVLEVPAELAGSRVLVVEGAEENRALLQGLMTDWGFDSAAASTGAQALAALDVARSHGIQVDAMLLSCDLPDAESADVVAGARAKEGMADLPVILLTAPGEAAATSANVQGRIDKTANDTQLLSSIINVLSPRHGDANFGPAEHPRSEPTDEELLALPIPPKLEVVSGNNVPADEAPEEIDVLVAEDNELNQLMFEQLLEDASLSFKVAEHGHEAVEMYKRHKPRLIFMDVAMPILDGFEATAQIRKLEQSAGTHTPVIAITAHALSGGMETCFEAGMDDYLTKPLLQADFEAKLEHWLEPRALARTA